VDAVVVAALKDKQANRRAAAAWWSAGRVRPNSAGARQWQAAARRPRPAGPFPGALQGLSAGRDRARHPALICAGEGRAAMTSRSAPANCSGLLRIERWPLRSVSVRLRSGRAPGVRANAWESAGRKHLPNFVGFFPPSATPTCRPSTAKRCGRSATLARQFLQRPVVGDHQRFQKKPSTSPST